MYHFLDLFGGMSTGLSGARRLFLCRAIIATLSSSLLFRYSAVARRILCSSMTANGSAAWSAIASAAALPAFTALSSRAWMSFSDVIKKCRDSSVRRRGHRVASRVSRAILAGFVSPHTLFPAPSLAINCNALRHLASLARAVSRSALNAIRFHRASSRWRSMLRECTKMLRLLSAQTASVSVVARSAAVTEDSSATSGADRSAVRSHFEHRMYPGFNIFPHLHFILQ